MEPYGLLPWGVVGWKRNGSIQVIANHEPPRLYTAPLTFKEVRWSDVLEAAGQPQNRQLARPHVRVVKLQETGHWHSFEAYKYRHWWAGNHMVLRYHAFFRNVRQVPTSSNVIRKGPNINYIIGDKKQSSPTPRHCSSSSELSLDQKAHRAKLERIRYHSLSPTELEARNWKCWEHAALLQKHSRDTCNSN